MGIIKAVESLSDTTKLTSFASPDSPAESSASWSYQEAFSRNLGLVAPAEQERLRTCHVAVLGLGGVGGINLVTLARLGVGRFTIADPDVFEVANFNRQYGAMCSNVGRRKAEVMRDIILDINPTAEIRLFQEPIGVGNADAFLEGVDVLVDGIDAFEIDVRRLLYHKARERGIYALGAGPVGFSTIWVIFAPDGMSFDEYFDLTDAMDSVEKFAAYLIGMAPAGLHRGYMDLSYVDPMKKTGPSASSACHLAGGVIGTEVLKILLKRGRIYSAPYYHQFDPYVGRFVRRYLFFANRNPFQRFKRRWLVDYLKRNIRG